jgi:hypothetical protein
MTFQEPLTTIIVKAHLLLVIDILFNQSIRFQTNAAIFILFTLALSHSSLIVILILYVIGNDDISGRLIVTGPKVVSAPRYQSVSNTLYTPVTALI